MPSAKPSNRSNRFEVADRINALLSPDAEKTGPFWCASEGAAYGYRAREQAVEQHLIVLRRTTMPAVLLEANVKAIVTSVFSLRRPHAAEP